MQTLSTCGGKLLGGGVVVDGEGPIFAVARTLFVFEIVGDGEPLGNFALQLVDSSPGNSYRHTSVLYNA